MKDFKKKWFISASSGILGKTLLVVLCLGAGFVGGQYISVPIDKDIIDKDIIKGVGFIVGMVVFIFAVGGFFYFPLILEWFADKRESENEKLQLENENLKLKLELQEKQSQRDNDE